MKKNPCFFKFFLPGFTEEHLKIPKSFLKHLVGDGYGLAYLKGPTGAVWRVNLVETDRGVFLQNGWKRFVTDNSIQMGFCFVFKYHGNLRFKVTIYDTSACEAHSRPPYRSFSPICVENKGVPKNMLQKQLVRRSSTDYFYQFVSQRRTVTEEEIKKTYNVAKSFKSRKPCALVVMRPTYVSHASYLYFPRAFARTSLPKTSLIVTIYDPNDIKWNIRYTYNQTSKKAFISEGWSAFVLANNLEEHDVCVFELVESFKMQVYIFRVVDQITPLLKYHERLR